MPSPSRRAVRLLLGALLLLLPALAACGSSRAASATQTPTVRPSPTSPPRPTDTPVPPTATAAPATGPRNASLTILHTNDVQGEVDPCG